MHKRAEPLCHSFPMICRKEINMTDYFSSKGFREDFTNLLKSLVLISKRIEELTGEVSEVCDILRTNLNKENSTEHVVTPPNP